MQTEECRDIPFWVPLAFVLLPFLALAYPAFSSAANIAVNQVAMAWEDISDAAEPYLP